MIECEIIGGPKDGIRVALRDVRPFNVAVPTSDVVSSMLEEAQWPLPVPSFVVVTMMPELTMNGWVLRWREPKC